MRQRRARLALLAPSLLAVGLLLPAPGTLDPALAGAQPAVVVDPVAAVPPAAPARTPGIAPPLETAFTVAEGVVRRTLAFGPHGLVQTLDVYSPSGPPQPRPTVLLVHGGGWQIGDSTEWTTEAVDLVRTHGWTAVALNYRLAPQHVWPSPYDDAVAAVRLLQARAAELGIDPDRIGAVGDSAGAHLAALLGEPAADRPAVRAVVTWSGVNDLAGVVGQRSSGGCAATGCAHSGLAAKVVRDLMGCAPAACPDEYRAASPAAGVTAGHASTLSLSSEGEQIDPRQAWVMDAALSRHGVPSRVQVLPGSLHARGFQPTAWPATVRFLAATLTPETAQPYPPAAVVTTLDLPARSAAAVGRPVRLHGVVRPRQAGTSVALQVRQPDGSWRTARTAPLLAGPVDTAYDLAWTPTGRGTTVWRAVWRGSGTVQATSPRAVVVR
ncbi:MAG: putative esterase/lipase [Frankiales bacterium]|nr:putative esterase/lipase [Frankiales bacterium]